MFRRSSTKSLGWLILLEPDAWIIVALNEEEAAAEKVPFAPEATAEQAGPIHDALIAAGWRGEPILAALSANSCLAATVEVPTPAMLRKRQAMRFHLEGWIPWSAEEFVADYIPHKTSAFMVAARIEPLKTLLDDLEERGVTTATVTPEVLLAVERHLAADETPPDHTLVWQHGGETELLMVQQGRLVQWQHSEGDATDLVRLCIKARLDGPATSPWYVRGFTSDQAAQLTALGIEVVQLDGLGWADALRDAAKLILGGQAEPPMNLRSDDLAAARPAEATGPQRRQLAVATVAAALATCSALWLRGDAYERSAAAYREQLPVIYEQTFPKEPVPERILPTMRKAQGLLQATRGPAKELAVAPDSDLLLDKVLAALPADLRYRVPEIRIEGSTVHVASEVRSNADADRLALALQTAGFDVDPPRIQRLAEQGFAARLAARLSGNEGAAVQ